MALIEEGETTLCIGGFSFFTSQEDIRQMADPFGAVAEVYGPFKSKKTDDLIAYVIFKQRRSMENMIAELNGTTLTSSESEQPSARLWLKKHVRETKNEPELSSSTQQLRHHHLRRQTVSSTHRAYSLTTRQVGQGQSVTPDQRRQPLVENFVNRPPPEQPPEQPPGVRLEDSVSSPRLQHEQQRVQRQQLQPRQQLQQQRHPNIRRDADSFGNAADPSGRRDVPATFSSPSREFVDHPIDRRPAYDQAIALDPSRTIASPDDGELGFDRESAVDQIDENVARLRLGTRARRGLNAQPMLTPSEDRGIDSMDERQRRRGNEHQLCQPYQQQQPYQQRQRVPLPRSGEDAVDGLREELRRRLSEAEMVVTLMARRQMLLVGRLSDLDVVSEGTLKRTEFLDSFVTEKLAASEAI